MSVGFGLLLQLDPLLDQYRVWLLKGAIFLSAFFGTYLLGRIVIVPPIVRAVTTRNPDNQTLVGAITLYLRVALVVLAVPVAITAAGFGGVAFGSGVVLAAATLAGRPGNVPAGTGARMRVPLGGIYPGGGHRPDKP